MFIIQVWMTIAPEHLEAFLGETMMLGNQTKQEGGNIRYEVLQNKEVPNQISLLEVYQDDSAFNAHLEAPHFEAWKSATESMVTDSSSITYEALFPSPNSWKKS